jgi:hypothetical protein
VRRESDVVAGKRLIVFFECGADDASRQQEGEGNFFDPLLAEREKSNRKMPKRMIKHDCMYNLEQEILVSWDKDGKILSKVIDLSEFCIRWRIAFSLDESNNINRYRRDGGDERHLPNKIPGQDEADVKVGTQNKQADYV